MKCKLIFNFVLVLSLITGITTTVFANTLLPNQVKNNNYSVASDNFKKIQDKIPKKMKGKLDEKHNKLLINGNAYAVLNAFSIMIANNDSPWLDSFKKGEFKIKRVVPIFDLNDELSEIMFVFNKGYMIVDINGSIIQYSYGPVDLSYFDTSEKIYVNNIEHFSIDEYGTIKDGSKIGKNITKIKKIYEGKIKDENKTQNKWKFLDENGVNSLLNLFYATGVNEGTSEENLITDPKLWLSNWYKNEYSGVSDMQVNVTDNLMEHIQLLLKG